MRINTAAIGVKINNILSCAANISLRFRLRIETPFLFFFP